MFVDQVKLKLSAGKGGNGVVAWRREKYLPKGGPSGGNGGKGGSIYLVSSHDAYSLESFRNQRIIHAESGKQGGSSRCQGKSGQDLYLKVPTGTTLREATTNTLLFDFTEEGQEYLLCQGGFGGKGNYFFKTSKRRAPNFCTEGKEGESIEIELELKLIADIGLIGMPNAGKSTLLSKLAHIPVKVAPYPFTTLIPNLGFFEAGDKRILLADIPGIIEGAHENKGLGLSFLKHIERTSALLFVLDGAGSEARDPVQDFKVLEKELQKHNPLILEKPFLVVLNKKDLPSFAEKEQEFKKIFPSLSVHAVSAEKEEGLSSLKDKLLLLKDAGKKKETKRKPCPLLSQLVFAN